MEDAIAYERQRVAAGAVLRGSKVSHGSKDEWWHHSRTGAGKAEAVMAWQPHDWMAAAACKDADPALFSPTQGKSGRKGAEICAGCSVRAECEQYARDTDSVGVWGGLLFREGREAVGYGG